MRSARLSAAAVALSVSGALPAAATTAQLVTASGALIGQFMGHGSGYAEDGSLRGTYAVVSARGYVGDLLPDGRFAQQPALVYANADCRGRAYLEVSNLVGAKPPVPGLVFAFGEAGAVYAVKTRSHPTEITVASMYALGNPVCIQRHATAAVYAIDPHSDADTGFADRYAGPLAIRATATRARERAVRLPATRRAGTTTAPPGATTLPLPPSMPECAAGCNQDNFGDGVCQSECLNSLCGFDGGDCSAEETAAAQALEAKQCAPTCAEADRGDGFCDARCNSAACGFDNGDCQAH
jgi:hypothetical protein